jgi:hypothetical protein
MQNLWFLDVSVDRFRRAKRFVNDAVGPDHVSMLRAWPLVGRFSIKLQHKNRPMRGYVTRPSPKRGNELSVVDW